MKRIVPIFITLCLYNLCNAQVTVSGSTGVNGTYASLSTAFTAINGAATQTGNNILITITTDLVEPGTPTTLTYNNWATLTMQPVGARTISGTPVNQLIGLNGAKFVIIDGLNTGGNSLLINCSNTLPALTFFNAASNNTIKNLTVKANANASTSGVIFFSNTTAGGDNNNVIDNCDIAPVTSGSAVNLVYSNGSAAAVNKADTIRNCRLYDNFNATISSYSILLDANNDSWVIEHNDFYQTASRTTSSGTPVYAAININGCLGDNFKINYNSIGGTSATHTGYSTYGSTGTQPAFKGIILNNAGPAAAAYPSGSYVTNNIIKGIQINSGRVSTVKGNNVFVGIEVNNGVTTDAANITNNTVGGFGTDLIKIEATSTTANQVPCAGIYNRSSKGNVIEYNTIGSVNMYQTASTAKTTSFDAIYADPTTNSSTSISYNTIGGTKITTVYSAARVYGIELGNTSTSGTAYTVMHNTISRLEHTSTNVTANYPLAGINCTGGGDQATIAFNQVGYISFQGSFSGASSDIYAAGIRALSQTGVGAQPNRIYKNQVFFLNAPVNGNSACGIIGISLLGGGTHYVYNNMVSIGEATGSSSLVLGINQNGSNTLYLYNNSIYVQGSVGFGNVNTCLRRYDNTGTIYAYNNVFKIDRDGYGINFVTTPVSATPYTGNNNIFYTPNGYAALINGTPYPFTFYPAGLPAGNTEGSGTKEADVTFTDLPALHTLDLDVINAGKDLSAATPLAVTDDFDGDARNGCFDIGADEVLFKTGPNQLTWIGSIDTKWCTPCNWDKGVSPDSLHTVFLESGAAQYPIIDAAHNCSVTGVPQADSVNIASGATLTINSAALEIYGQLNNNGTLSNTGGSVGFASAIKDQEINSASDLQFNDLYIKGLSTKKYLYRNTTVNTFAHCIACAANLLLGSNNLTVNTAATGSATSHIVTNNTGKLIVKNITAGAKLFPIGPDETHYNPLSIASGDGKDYTAGVETGISPSGTANPLLGVNRTWNITASATPSAPVNVTFTYYDADVNSFCAPHANMDLGHYYTSPVAVWQVDQLGQPVTVAAPNTVTFNIANWTAYNPFIVGNAGFILALDNDISLLGSRQNNYCRLSWTMANSNYTGRFDVLRSTDGISFNSIGTVNATAGVRNYNFTDINPNGGKNFYRIKLYGSIGGTVYSNIALLAGADGAKTIVSVYPSPVRSTANVSIRADENQQVLLHVFDAHAKLLLTLAANLVAGENVLPVDLEKVAAGYYFIRINTAQQTQTIWFMKE